MNRFEDLILRLPSGVNFFRLLEARPALAEHLAAILSHAPPLAEQLGRRAGPARRPDRRQRLRAGAAGRGARRATSPGPTAPARIISSCSTGSGGGSTRRRFALGVAARRSRHADPLEVSRGLCAGRRGGDPGARRRRRRRVRGARTAGCPARELRHPRPRPARRRGADPCLRPRPRLSVQRQPRGGIGRPEAAARHRLFQPAGAAGHAPR